MAKNDNTLLIIGGILFFAWMMSNQGNTEPTTNGGVDLCKLVESEASFTGQRMFLQGTSLTNEYVRVIKLNGGDQVKDLGLSSMNSGTLSTTPKATYNLYFGENSSTYYTHKEVYNAPCSDAKDDKVGVECYMDNTPTISVFDEYGNVQSTTANFQAVDSDDERDIVVRVRVSGDQCYGNPDAEGDNAICFRYNTSVFDSVTADTGSQSTPYNISTNYAGAGLAISCYKLNKLQDHDYQDVNVKLDSTSDDPGDSDSHNITLYTDDIAFDIDADSLAEIWGFEDEDNNPLGVVEATGHIYVS
jgi:hypothetical protein